MKFDNEDFEEEIYDEDKYDALNDETFGNDMSGTVQNLYMYLVPIIKYNVSFV